MVGGLHEGVEVGGEGCVLHNNRNGAELARLPTMSCHPPVRPPEEQVAGKVQGCPRRARQ